MSSTVSRPNPAPSPATASENDKFEHYVARQLSRTGTHVKLVDVVAALCHVLVVLLGTLLAVCVVDAWIFNLSPLLRLLLLVGMVGYSLFVLSRTLVPLLVWRINPAYSARMIEQSEPKLKNSLLNYLFLRSRPERQADPIYGAVQQRAAQDLSAISVESAVDRSQLIRVGFVLVAIVLACALYKLFSPKDPFQTISRVMAPLVDFQPPSRIQILKVDPGSTEVFFGDKLPVVAEIRGAGSTTQVSIVFSSDDGQFVDAVLPMQRGDSKSIYTGELAPTENGIQQSLRYRVIAADGQSSEFYVRVHPSPTMAVAAVELIPPAYTGWPNTRQEGKGDVEAIEQTQLRLEAKANMPIQSAFVELLKVRSKSNPLEPTAYDSVQRLGMKVEQANATVDWKLSLQDDLPLYTHYRIRFNNQQGQSSRDEAVYTLKVFPDIAPEITVDAPTTEINQVPLNGKLDVKIRAADPDFRISAVRLFVAHKGKLLLQQNLPLDPPSGVGNITASYVVRPEALQLKTGDEAIMYAIAMDNRQAEGEIPDPNQSRSGNYTIQVTPPERQANDGSQSDPSTSEFNQSQSDPSQSGNQGESSQPDQSNADNQQQPGGENSQQGNSGGSGNQSSDSSSEPSDNSQSSGGQPGNQQNPSNDQQNQPGQQSSAGDNTGAASDPQNSGDQSGQPGEMQSSENQPDNQSQPADSQSSESAGNNSAQPATGESSNAQPATGENSNAADANSGASENRQARPMDDSTPDGERIQRLNDFRERQKNDPTTTPDGLDQPRDPQADNSQSDQPAGNRNDTDRNQSNSQMADPANAQPADNSAADSGEPNKSESNQGDQPGDQSQSSAGNKGSDQTDPNKSNREPGDNSDAESDAAQTGDQNREMENSDGQQNAENPSSDPANDSQSSSENQPGDSESQSDQNSESETAGDQNRTGDPSDESEAQQRNPSTTGDQIGENSNAQSQPADETGDSDSSEPAGAEDSQSNAGNDSRQGTDDSQTPSESESSDPTSDGDEPGQSNKDNQPPNSIPMDRTPGNEFNPPAETQIEKEKLEESREVTELVLDYLKDQQFNPDPDLLSEMNWTDQELNDFLDRWEAMRQAAEAGQEGAQERYDEALRSLGLQSRQPSVRRSEMNNQSIENLNEDSAISRPPPSIEKDFKEFLKRRSSKDSNR